MSTSPKEDAVPERPPTSYAVPPAKGNDGYSQEYQTPSYSSRELGAKEQAATSSDYDAPLMYVPPARPQTPSQPATKAQKRHSARDLDHGRQLAKYSVVFGILGIVFFLPGPIVALVFASKAEKLGVPAAAGRVLGWIGVAILVAAFAWGWFLG